MEPQTNPDLKILFGHRLAQARRMHGLSLRGLAEKLGGQVSYNALHKYELGKMMPDSTVLVAVADALDQSLDFFFRARALELKGIQFRKTTRLGAKEQTAIQEKALDHFERQREIEQILGLARPFHNPLAGPDLVSQEDAEAAAEKLRVAWKLGDDPLPNVLEMLEGNGIPVFEVEAPESFNGFAAWAGDQLVMVLGKWLDGDLPRKRFTALHELGHLLLPMSAGLPDRDVEGLCHRFAGAMLIPRPVFVTEFGGHRQRIGWDELEKIKGRFGMSMAAIMRRARSLDLITAALYERFCILTRQMGWHKAEPGVYTGREKSSRFEQLVVRAASESLVSTSKGASLLNEPYEEFQSKLAGVD